MRVENQQIDLIFLGLHPGIYSRAFHIALIDKPATGQPHPTLKGTTTELTRPHTLKSRNFVNIEKGGPQTFNSRPRLVGSANKQNK